MRIPGDYDAALSTLHRNWVEQQAQAATATRRLSSGVRVGSAVDDAAGLAIAQRIDSRVQGLHQASRNVQDGISMMQVAEGSLAGMQDILAQVRVIAVQAANDTFDATQRGAIQSAVDLLLDALDEHVEHTRGAGVGLLDGSSPTMTLQVGADAGDTLAVHGADVRTRALGLALEDGAWAVSVRTAEDARSALDALDEAIGEMLRVRTRFGVAQNRLEFMLGSLDAAAGQAGGAHSRIVDADVAAEATTAMRAQLWSQAGARLMAQVVESERLVLRLLRGLPSPTDDDASTPRDRSGDRGSAQVPSGPPPVRVGGGGQDVVPTGPTVSILLPAATSPTAPPGGDAAESVAPLDGSGAGTFGDDGPSSLTGTESGLSPGTAGVATATFERSR